MVFGVALPVTLSKSRGKFDILVPGVPTPDLRPRDLN